MNEFLFANGWVYRSSAARPASFYPQAMADAVEVEVERDAPAVVNFAADGRWGARPAHCAAAPDDCSAELRDDRCVPVALPDDCCSAAADWAPDGYSAGADSAQAGCSAAQTDDHCVLAARMADSVVRYWAPDGCCWVPVDYSARADLARAGYWAANCWVQADCSESADSAAADSDLDGYSARAAHPAAHYWQGDFPADSLAGWGGLLPASVLLAAPEAPLEHVVVR